MLPTDVSFPSIIPSGMPISTMEEATLPLVEELAEEISSEVSEVVDFSELNLATRLSRLLCGESDLIEEEVTNGMTHALLDFGSFWTENAVYIKALAVVGRIVVLVHSFSHGQEVLPDELAFQLGFLGLSVNSLYQAALPKLEARKRSLFMTSKDRLAFRSVFRSAGFSWKQFHEISHQSMNWVTVEPGQVVSEQAKDDAVYWLYQGDVKIQNKDKEVVHNVSCKDKKSGMGLLGETRLASLMDGATPLGASGDEATKAKTFVAGDSGATLLRMDVPKLRNISRHHEEMTANFGRLAFSAMQDKLNALRMTAN